MTSKELLEKVVSSYKELISYEYLCSREKATFTKVSDKTINQNKLPSTALREEYGIFAPPEYEEIESYVKNRLKNNFSVLVNGTYDYPEKLIDADKPTPILYYKGDLSLIESKSISIVGARKATDYGIIRAKKIAKEMARNNITVVSGLARGIDTAAMTSAINNGGRLIGVIGTPIDIYYPKENKVLQDYIANANLLISQVPIYKYDHQTFQSKKSYFTDRNKTMAAISDATVIIEASDTSGTLVQARACLAQKRPLFILRSAMDNISVTWPRKFANGENELVVVISHPSEIFDFMKSKKIW